MCRFDRCRWFAVAALVVLAGCIGVPQPEPPSLQPMRLEWRGNARNGSAMYTLPPGAVTPAGGHLWVVGLDDVEDPQRLLVEEDGSVESFDVSSRTFRLQARDGDARGMPWDFRAGSGDPEVVLPASPCLDVAFEREVGSAAVGRSLEASVELINGCDAAVSLGEIRLRRESDFAVDARPRTIEPGSRASVTLRFNPSAEGPREEVLLIVVEAPVPERRAVTLFGRGLP